MHDPNRALLEAAARVLQPLLDELVFLGGCATGLLLTDPATAGLRPTTEEVLGFANRWYIPALGAAQSLVLAELQIRVITPVYFLATKLEAFHARGQGDVSGSHDLEDVITVIDGRPELIDEVRFAPPDVRRYIATAFQQLMADRAFMDALPGFLLPDSATQARLPILIARLTALSSHGS